MFNRILDNAATPAQRRAHNTLTLLLAEEGLGSASDIYADVVSRSREEAFAERHGLSRCTGTVCLGRLFGGRCRHVSGENEKTPHVPPGNEHPTLWARDGHTAIYVFQPYKDALTADLLRNLAEFCQTYELTLKISDEESFHYPGRTMLIMIRQKQ